jgi:hypothetical protein
MYGRGPRLNVYSAMGTEDMHRFVFVCSQPGQTTMSHSSSANDFVCGEGLTDV